MQVRNAMSTNIIIVGLEDTLREAARRMSERGAGSAVVDPGTSGSGPGIFTEQDLLDSVAAGQNPDNECVADHFTSDAVTVSSDSSLEQAAEEMASGGFRHLVVIDGNETVGIVSMRDVVERWTDRVELPGVNTAVRDAMNSDVPTVGLEDTLREAARRMSEQDVGAAVVDSAETGGHPRIVTMREVLHSVGAGQDPDAERVADHLAPSTTFSAPNWMLVQAAEAMVKADLQHAVVVDGDETVGIISMRELARNLTSR
jgi:predicted transcriptional regulator